MVWFPCNIGGGGPSGIANILKGTSDPASSIGDNGQLYLKYGLKGALLHFDDFPTSDATGDGNSWDTHGTDPVISDTQSKFGGHSLQFSSSEAGYLQTDNYEANSYMGTFDNHDFTISCWIYPISGERQTIFAASHDCRLGVDIFYNGSSANMWMGSANGSWNEIQSDDSGASNSGIGTITINQNEWTHFAMTRKGDKVRSFINGQLSKEVTISSAGVSVYYNNDRFRIGYWGNNGYQFRGYMDDFLILNGAALWDSAFTPPARAFSLDDFSSIINAYAKVDNAWQDLIDTDIDEITYTVNPPTEKIAYLKWQITKSRSVPAGGCIQVAEFRLYLDAERYVWSNDVSISCDMEGVSGETIDNLIDNNINTKFNTTDWGSVQENECNIIISLGETITFTSTPSYCFVTANDEISRDPVSWKLYGSMDGTNWNLLDERDDADITTNRQAQTFNYPCNIGGGTSVDTSNLLFKDGEFYNTDKVELGIENGVVSDGTILFTTSSAVGGIYFNSSTLDGKFAIVIHYENDNQSVQVRMQYGTSKVGTSVVNVINSGTDRYTYASKSVNKGVNDLVTILKETDGDDTIGAFFGNQSANATWKIYEIYLIPY